MITPRLANCGSFFALNPTRKEEAYFQRHFCSGFPKDIYRHVAWHPSSGQ